MRGLGNDGLYDGLLKSAWIYIWKGEQEIVLELARKRQTLHGRSVR